MEKIVARRVVTPQGPIKGFFSGLAASIKGIATGLILIVVSFVLVYNFAFQKEHSKVLESLELKTPDQAMDYNGMVKIHGVPDISTMVVEPNTNKDQLMYRTVAEEYAVREVKKTRSYEQNGQTIEEDYIEYTPDWQVKSDTTKWSEFKLGKIDINPGNAKLKFNYSTIFEKTEDVPYNNALPEDQLVGIAQKMRVTVTGVAKDADIIVVGSNSNNKIASGEEGTFFISNMTDAELLGSQKSAEKTSFWIMVAISWFMMTTGFTMLFGPITKILNIIPGVGGLFSGLLFFVFGILSAVIIFISYLGMKYWWTIIIAIFAVIAFFVYKKRGASAIPMTQASSGNGTAPQA